VAEDQGKEEEKFDFTPEGEGYISLAEARVLAMQTASSAPGDYGRSFRGVAMVFEVVESGEDDDYYTVTLSFRPQGNFDGAPGQEQFVIGKESTIALRQVLSSPVREDGGFPVMPVVIGLVAVGAIAAVGAVLALGSFGGDNVPVAAVTPTETPAPIEPTINIEKTVEAAVQQGLAASATSAPPTPTFTPIPTYTPYPTPTPRPTYTPRPTPTFTPMPTYTPYPTPSPRPTYTPRPTPTARVIVVTPTPTPRPIPTSTPRTTSTPTGPEFYIGAWVEGSDGLTGQIKSVQWMANEGLYRYVISTLFGEKSWAESQLTSAKSVACSVDSKYC